MKTAIRFALCVMLMMIGLAPAVASTTHSTLSGAGRTIKSLENIAVDDAETEQLNAIFANASKNAAAIPPGKDSGLQRRALDDDLRVQLNAFVSAHSNSAWAPGTHLFLARRSQLQSSYLDAIGHYRKAWIQIKNLPNGGTQPMAVEASGGLAKLLVLTGHEDQMDALYGEAKPFLKVGFGGGWTWALEMRRWTKKRPDESHKCGLYCLDQLGRLTQPGHYLPKDVLETRSSPDGFTAADLVQLGTKAGLHVHAAMLTDLTNLPVPSVIHLQSEHFVFLREQRNGFYDVYDPVAFGKRWLTAAEIAQESTGCVIVSDSSLSNTIPLTFINLASAAGYRGRCHNPQPADVQDSGGCTNIPCYTCPCPKCPPGGSSSSGSSSSGSSSSGSSSSGSSSSGSSSGSGSGCKACGGGPSANVNPDSISGSGSGRGYDVTPGMPAWVVTEPYLSTWLMDIPMQYQPAFGPTITLRIAYNPHSEQSTIFGDYIQGAEIGNSGGLNGLWACSWFSFVEYDSSSSNDVQVLLPGGGWAEFDFPSGSNISSVNYLHNLWMQKQVDGSGNVTNFLLHYQNGGLTAYGVIDNAAPSYYAYYMTSEADPAGNRTTYAYNTNFYLTNVTAADGTYFSLLYTNTSCPGYVTGVTSSYGASVHFDYDTTYQQSLVGITDAAGIKSIINYQFDVGPPLSSVVTPYGTTGFNTFSGDESGNDGVFERFAEITNPDNSIEFYGLINEYTNTDWPDYATSQIPTNTLTRTLDTNAGSRLERNTIYWNAQQFAPYVSVLSSNPNNFNWSMFKTGRIKHWLGGANLSSYTHYVALSAEQDPSPDGTTEGQITWYDYTNKPAGVNYEIGTQVMASDIAKVMPDGTTWYQHLDYTTNGLLLDTIEKWVSGGTDHFRTNTYVYAANGVDLIVATNALGVRVLNNVYNGFHQIVTNYDALNQMTTFTYDSTTLQLTSISWPGGLVRTNVYYTNHRLNQMIDLQINRTNGYAWNSDGTIFCHTNELGLVVTNFWDGLHRLIGKLYPDGTTTSNLYSLVNGIPYADGSGTTNIVDLTATRDRLGYWTYYAYDSRRRLSYVTNANNVVTAYGYCDCGALTSVTNALGTGAQAVTQYVYDDQPRLIQIHFPDNSVVSNTFDNIGRVTVVGDAYGQETNTYDNLGRLIAVSNYFGRVATTAYDVTDRATNTVDANGVCITDSYDNLARLLFRTYPDGGMEYFSYSSNNLVAYTNQLTNATYYGYDAAGRKIAETNANAETNGFTYDPAGDLLTLTDGKNQTTAWNYNVFGLVTNKVDATSTVILAYAYDADNRLTNRWSAAKGNTYYAYDAVGNLTNITYPVSPSISLAYDPMNRPTNMIDAVGTTAYSYNGMGQLLTEDGPWANDAVTYTYNARMRSSMSLQQPNSDPWNQTYGYDGAKRLTSTVSPAGSFTYSYDSTARMQVANLALPNGANITNTYDNVARMLSTSLKNSSGTDLDSYTYTCNVGNQRTSVTRTETNYVNYAYDPIGQLTNATGKEANGTPRMQEQFAYAYDAAHNLSVRTNNGLVQDFTVNSLNELTNVTRTTGSTLTVTGSAAPPGGTISVTGVTVNGLTASVYADNTFAKDGFSTTNGNNSYTAIAHDATNRYSTNTVTAYLPATNSFTYDANGNLLSDGNRNFAYDDENELTNVYVTNAWMSQFVYDGKLRRRITKEFAWQGSSWVQTNETHYIYDGNLVIQERNSMNLPIISYTRGYDVSGSFQDAGGNGGLLALSQKSAIDLKHYFYHCDANGSITALIDLLQQTAASYIYDPYGSILSMSGPIATLNIYRWCSKEFHAQSGLTYCLMRFFDPNLQRWLNVDPIGELGGLNLYAYCQNDPIDFFDPFGLDPLQFSPPIGLRNGFNNPPGTNNPSPPPGTNNPAPAPTNHAPIDVFGPLSPAECHALANAMQQRHSSPFNSLYPTNFFPTGVTFTAGWPKGLGPPPQAKPPGHTIGPVGITIQGK